jgi:hypothetical protein
MSTSNILVDRLIDLTAGRGSTVPAVVGVSREGPTWVDSPLSDTERLHIEIIRRFWEVWKAEPFDPSLLREFFTPGVVVRTGWRGDHVSSNREAAMAGFIEEVKRQVEHEEHTDFKIPILVAKGPLIFHTWTWISESHRLHYRFERPMAAIFLFRDQKIERWDNYATGKESEFGFLGDGGPDGL